MQCRISSARRSPAGRSCGSTEATTHIWFRARDAATLIPRIGAVLVMGLNRVLGELGSRATTVVSTMTSRSSPWKFAASPHRISRCAKPPL